MPKTKTSARRIVDGANTRPVKDGDRRIIMTDKTNPRRPGTGQYEQFEVLKRYAGKKVAAFLAAKGADRTQLKRTQDEGIVKLSK